MSFWKKLFQKETKEPLKVEKEDVRKEPEVPSINLQKDEPEPLPDWADDSMTEEEEELIAVIAVAGLANSLPAKKFRVKKVLKVDEDWLVAGLAAISGVSQGSQNESYQIKSIKRIK